MAIPDDTFMMCLIKTEGIKTSDTYTCRQSLIETP